jgi:hypothetical protein
MRGEGRQALRDRLLVTDVRVERVEDRKPGPWADGRHDTGLRQRRDEPRRLEEDALPARVRTRHHDRPLPVPQVEVEGNDAFEALRLDEQRVTCAEQPDALGWIVHQLRYVPAPSGGDPCPRVEAVEVREGGERAAQVVTHRSESVAQAHQDAPNLPRLLALEVP